jgi:hypothetical protein
MTWVPLLLADSSPCLRSLVLRELMHRPKDDPEVQELTALRDTDPLVSDLFAMQAADGSWKGGDLAWRGGKVSPTCLALMRLGYLGFDAEHPVVRKGADYLFSQQRDDGSWPLPQGQTDPGNEGYTMMPLQTALPLRSVAACGYATDPRAERGYTWLLEQRLPDGAWPTGIASGNYGYVAGYRRLAHSRWGCRSNTTGALLCLALHPEQRHSPEARRALDLLLGRETQEAHTLGFEVARLVGAEPTRGFLTFYARFDLAQILDLCWRVGADPDDERVADISDFVQTLQGPYGLWDYTAQPKASRWVTLDLLRSLSRLHKKKANDWISLEPRTPFQAYPKRARRY